MQHTLFADCIRINVSYDLNKANNHINRSRSVTMIYPERVKDISTVESYKNGVQTFAKLFTRWMDTNEWSHPVMTYLARSALGGTAWLHSSQISGLRHGKLVSPGPRTFLAIAELNRCLHIYLTEKRLIPGTESSNYYAHGYCIVEDGIPPTSGWWFEVFCGQRVPKDIDLSAVFYSEDDATGMSRIWAKAFRRLVANEGYDLYEDLDKILRLYYPAKDIDRVDIIARVARSEAVWTPEQLINELPALTKLTAALGGPQTEEELIAEIS